MVDINRSRDCESVIDRGRDPARKDLKSESVHFEASLRRSPHAIAIMVLKVSSIKRPSSILKQLPLVVGLQALTIPEDRLSIRVSF